MTAPIEAGIPVPRMPQGRAPLYPFATMAVGDSFFVADTSEPKRLQANRVIVAARGYVVRHAPAARFTTRQVEGGVRCWRVA